jgi:ribonuclease HI
VSIIAVYADGGVLGGNPSPDGGTWAYCHVDERGFQVYQSSGFVPAVDYAITNNQMEFLAVLSALESLPEGWSGKVCSDSRVTLMRFFQSASMRGIPRDWYQRGSRALQRLGRLQAVHLAGHPTRAQLRVGSGKHGLPVSVHQVWCDAECGRQAEAWSSRIRLVGYEAFMRQARAERHAVATLVG